MTAEDSLGSFDQEVEPAGSLHHRQGGDDREDHAQHDGGRAARRHAEREDEDRQPDSAHRAEPDAPEAGTDHDATEQYRQLEEKHSQPLPGLADHDGISKKYSQTGRLHFSPSGLSAGRSSRPEGIRDGCPTLRRCKTPFAIALDTH